MTSVFEIFDPGMAHWRRQKDLEKVLVHTTDQGASGPKPLDLESGKVEIEIPSRAAIEPTQPIDLTQPNDAASHQGTGADSAAHDHPTEESAHEHPTEGDVS